VIPGRWQDDTVNTFEEAAALRTRTPSSPASCESRDILATASSGTPLLRHPAPHHVPELRYERKLGRRAGEEGQGLKVRLPCLFPDD